MWPWGHLAIGYAFFSLYHRGRYGRPPDGIGLIALAFATQLPDLLDKPLAYTFGVFPKGRALLHSLLFGIPFLILLAVLARERESPHLTGFGIGYGSHFLGDFWQFFLHFDITETTLLWPIVPGPVYENTEFVDHLADLTQSLAVGNPGTAVALYPEFYGELVFTLLIFGLWVIEGRPGLSRTVSLVTGDSPSLERHRGD